MKDKIAIILLIFFVVVALLALGVIHTAQRTIRESQEEKILLLIETNGTQDETIISLEKYIDILEKKNAAYPADIVSEIYYAVLVSCSVVHIDILLSQDSFLTEEEYQNRIDFIVSYCSNTVRETYAQYGEDIDLIEKPNFWDNLFNSIRYGKEELGTSA